jgi:hypothetical protein
MKSPTCWMKFARMCAVALRCMPRWKTQKGVFSRFYLNMIRAGEAGGALEVVMLRLTEFMERAKELRETVKSALVYPTILIMVAVISVVVLLIFVVPQFTQMFEESGKALAAGDPDRDCRRRVLQALVVGADWRRTCAYASVPAPDGQPGKPLHAGMNAFSRCR